MGWPAVADGKFGFEVSGIELSGAVPRPTALGVFACPGFVGAVIPLAQNLEEWVLMDVRFADD